MSSNRKQESKLLSVLKENWLLLFAILYIISPIDVIPDWIPVAGQGDDALVLIIELINQLRKFKQKRASKVIDGEIESSESIQHDQKT
ncbi:DUF1232 domain-containing protein [Candidatus Dojkabacteria bacterium]|nr:DUF1232 domain-containing protein [Candidatus Dojkabacteria bacterium]